MENIREFATEPGNDVIGQYFSNEESKYLSAEHRDQILMLTGDASNYLWKFEHDLLGFQATDKFFKSVSYFNSTCSTDAEIKKYLYNTGIKFDSWVFIAEQPHLEFILTWKMVIKYFRGLFFDDYQQIWDSSFNWKLEFNHGQIVFGKDLVYNAEIESSKIKEAISEMVTRNLRNGV